MGALFEKPAFLILILIVLLLFGAKAVIDGELTVGALVAFNMIAGQAVQPVDPGPFELEDVGDPAHDVVEVLVHVGDDVVELPVDLQ